MRGDSNGKTPRDGGPSAQEIKREVVEFVKLVVWFLVLFFVLRTYVLEGYEVQGDSMTPTLQSRERILVFKLPHRLSRLTLLGLAPFSGLEAIGVGDVIVFESPDEANRRYVKRVVARNATRPRGNTVAAEGEGDDSQEGVVPVKIEGGQLYVNNHVVTEDYLPPEVISGLTKPKQVLLRGGECFVLGDNREVSKDSTTFGAVDDSEIIGRAVLRFWPLGRLGFIR